MGTGGTEASFSGDLVLDAGALIALERGKPEVLAIIEGAAILALRVVIPATVLAQVWRGGARAAPLARLIVAGEVDAMNEGRAKEVGVLLGHRDVRDVADAHVFCCAAERRAAVVTSDPDDIRRLAGPGERVTLIPV